MEAYRIANFTVQALYLLFQLLFMVRLFRHRLPTPVWHWFFVFTAMIWLWVFGRFLESVIYIFFPADNEAYVFAANFQYIGDTLAVAVYLLWNMYIAGYERIADKASFRVLVFTIPVIINILIFTNPSHHLMYTKLIMGQRVEHGYMFYPCFVAMYLELIVGYIVSIRTILRGNSGEKLKKILIFSMYPLLPALAVVIRSLSGVDRFDYTPVVLAVSFYLMYLILFRYSYVNIASVSVENILNQTLHPIIIYDPLKKEVLYENQIAQRDYRKYRDMITPLLNAGETSIEFSNGGKHIRVDVSKIDESENLLVTITDMTVLVEQKNLLQQKLNDQFRLTRSLEEKKRNIDAYLDALDSSESLKEKQILLDATRKEIESALHRIKSNLQLAEASPGNSKKPLEDNLRIAEAAIHIIRSTVSKLRDIS